MYLLKQWRESRALLLVALGGLIALVLMGVKVSMSAADHHAAGNNIDGFFVLLFSMETVVIGWWAWILGSAGIGRNLGEGSGAFLLTRPHRRAWFLWRDWSFAAAATILVTLATNVILLFFCSRLLAIGGMEPWRIPLMRGGSASLPGSLAEQALVVLAFSGLMYGLSSVCTLLLRRGSGMGLSAGLVVGYTLGSAIVGRLYSVHFPDLIAPMALRQDAGWSLTLHLIFVLVFPLAGYALLRRAEI